MGMLAAGLVASWLVLALAATLGSALTLRLLRRPQPWPEATPEVLVLVPVRGAGPLLPDFLAGLAAQDWPSWRVAFAVESAADPAHAVLARFVAAHPGRASLAIAGPATRRGQKVQNLLAALAALRPGDAAVVTLDADMLPPPGLLRALLRPVLTGQGAIASGYRWSLPAQASAPGTGAGWASRALCLIEAGIATLPRRAAANICWGGATAIGREALDRLDLPRLWDRAMSDDLVLTRAAQAAGLLIYSPLTARVPGPVALDARGVLEFGRRQYRLLRLHLPRAWLLAGLAALLPVLGGGAALAAALHGAPAGLAALGGAALLAGLRARLRGAIADRVLPPTEAALARRALARDAWLQPAPALLAAACFLASGLGREITWAGRRYRLNNQGQVLAVTLRP
ncbi:glycosyltransferase family 2 protein [Roseicella frigidaeris]|uniref:glycosyltransferase family 2 protein n=1 Tax=Roseicella frigidaeris TaxID=2230885 RepID=UPI0014041BD4|nr:glycosyltransferase family 2 protein [Roseicella frigidaeris]